MGISLLNYNKEEERLMINHYFILAYPISSKFKLQTLIKIICGITRSTLFLIPVRTTYAEPCIKFSNLFLIEGKMFYRH
jgi:hypothetical protein